MSYEMLVKIGVTTGYFALLLVIGVVTSRLISNIKDYFAAGKKLGYWLVSFSSRASGESGWLILGLTGLGFAEGIHAFWVTLGEVLGVLIAWLFLVQRFKLFTDQYESITIPDYLEDRFHDVHYIIRVVSSIVLSVFVTMYVAGQYVAAGKAFKGFLGLDVTTGIVTGMAIVIFYSVAGGLVAVVWSDLIQGILMFLGLTLVPLTALIAIGGPTELFQSLRAIEPIFLTISGSAGSWGWPTVFGILGFISIGWGFLGSPQLFVRFIAVKDNEELINGSVVAILFTIFTDLGAVITGMCGRVLYENLDWIGMVYGSLDREMVFPLMVEDMFPLWISAFFLAVVLAAIMSTADSLLVVASSAVVRDIYQKIFRPNASQKWLTILSRLVTFTLSLWALWFALYQGAPKFEVQRRNTPLTRLSKAADVQFPGDKVKAKLAVLNQSGINDRWIPAVRKGLSELRTNLISETQQLFSLKKQQINDITTTDFNRLRSGLIQSKSGGTIRLRNRLKSKLDRLISDVRGILLFDEDSTFAAELKELRDNLPDRPASSSEWEQWFGQLDIVKQDLDPYLNNNRTAILTQHKRGYEALMAQSRDVRSSFRSLLNSEGQIKSELTTVEIKTVQDDLGQLASRAKGFYPRTALQIEQEPMVFWFILIGWAGIASAFCPVIILSLYWERMTKWGAIAGMVTAFVVVSVWKFLPIGYVYMIPGTRSLVSVFGFEPMALSTLSDIIYMMVPGFLSSFLAIFVVSLLTEPPQEAREDLTSIRGQSVDFWEFSDDNP